MTFLVLAAIFCFSTSALAGSFSCHRIQIWARMFAYGRKVESKTRREGTVFSLA